jgi:hypothetical protein
VGLMDKVKAQASQLAELAQEKAQTATQLGQAKLDAYQTKRASDQLLRRLGAAVYAGAKGSVAEDTTKATVDDLIRQLREFEASHGSIDLTAAVKADPSPGAGATGQSTGAASAGSPAESPAGSSSDPAGS